MGHDKNSIDARPSMVKKNIFVSVDSTTACDLVKIQSNFAYLWKKNTLLQWFVGLGKNSIGTRSPPKNKYIFSFPATVLLWCLGVVIGASLSDLIFVEAANTCGKLFLSQRLFILDYYMYFYKSIDPVPINDIQTPPLPPQQWPNWVFYF